MHEVPDAVVKGGKVVLSGLPFEDGQHVRVVLTESTSAAPAGRRRPIGEVRRALRGGVGKFDDPTEPAIPTDAWEMLK